MTCPNRLFSPLKQRLDFSFFFLVPEHSTAAVGMYLKSLNNVCRTHVERARNQHNTAASKSQNSRIAFHLKNQQQYRRSKDDETKN